jgi:hypothetical protein
VKETIVKPLPIGLSTTKETTSQPSKSKVKELSMTGIDIDDNRLRKGDLIEVVDMDTAFSAPFTEGDRFTICNLYTKPQMDRMYRKFNIAVRVDMWILLDNGWFARCGSVRLIPKDKKSKTRIDFVVMELTK